MSRSIPTASTRSNCATEPSVPDLIVYAATGKSTYITGQSLSIDGGITA